MKTSKIMKFVAMFFVAAMLVTTACSKDSDNNNNNQSGSELVGTTWIGSAYGETTTLSFSSATTGSWTVSYEGYSGYSRSFSYSYSDGSGVISITDSHGLQNYPFTVQGSSLYCDGMTFYKK